VYDEEAFRYFLELERKRFEITQRPFLLLLIDLTKQMATDVRVDAATSKQLFSALEPCVRETDFIGWYHEGRVVGAVLTQHGATPVVDVQDAVCQRITSALGRGLAPDVARRLQVRAYKVPNNGGERS
jgi:hypothetical protein